MNPSAQGKSTVHSGASDRGPNSSDVAAPWSLEQARSVSTAMPKPQSDVQVRGPFTDMPLCTPRSPSRPERARGPLSGSGSPREPALLKEAPHVRCFCGLSS